MESQLSATAQPRRHRFQFSLRRLMIASLLCAVVPFFFLWQVWGWWPPDLCKGVMEIAQTPPTAAGLQFRIVQQAGPDLGYAAWVEFRPAWNAPYKCIHAIQADSPRLSESTRISYDEASDTLTSVVAWENSRYTLVLKFDGTRTGKITDAACNAGAGPQKIHFMNY